MSAPETNRFTLPNGLRVVHCRDTSTAMVALNIMYDVGARDEEPTLTGMAHLFEHLMFGGSENIDDFDGELTEAGGESNAWTGNDFTNFYDVAPAHNAETLFHLESDRMLAPGLSNTSLDIQRQVVIEEFKQQCLNRPYGDLMHHLRPMLYGKTHPYSWPVIGKSFAQLEQVTPTDVRRWFDTHYTPSRAVLAITGNISWERVLELTQKWFGDIPARKDIPRHIAPPRPLESTRVLTVTGNVPATSVTVAYLMDHYGTTRYHAADAITDILAAGKAARFLRHLVIDGDGTFTEADASIAGSEHEGMLLLNGRLTSEEVDPMHAAQLLIDEARKLAEEPVSDYDLTRLKNKQKAMAIISEMDYLGRGQRLAMAEMHGETPHQALDQYLALTTDDITAEAKQLFIDSHPAILIYRPATKTTSAQETL